MGSTMSANANFVFYCYAAAGRTDILREFAEPKVLVLTRVSKVRRRRVLSPENSRIALPISFN